MAVEGVGQELTNELMYPAGLSTRDAGCVPWKQIQIPENADFMNLDTTATRKLMQNKSCVEE